jgi:FkbM family methyltransferase
MLELDSRVHEANLSMTNENLRSFVRQCIFPIFLPFVKSSLNRFRKSKGSSQEGTAELDALHKAFRCSNDIRLEQGTIKVSELKTLVGKNDPTILEIGANVGQTTEEFLQVMPTSKIFCFEPDPRAIRKFRGRISNPNVTLFECAVGDQNGFVSFNQSSGEGESKDWDQSGSIRKPKVHLETWPWVKFESQIQVQIVRLDDWALNKNISGVDLMWADVQGAESDLISGGASVIRKTRFLFTEYGALEWYEGQVSLDEICEALFDLGLVLYRRFVMNALFVNKNLIDLKGDQLLK